MTQALSQISYNPFFSPKTQMFYGLPLVSISISAIRDIKVIICVFNESRMSSLFNNKDRNEHEKECSSLQDISKAQAAREPLQLQQRRYKFLTQPT